MPPENDLLAQPFRPRRHHMLGAHCFERGSPRITHIFGDVRNRQRTHWQNSVLEKIHIELVRLTGCPHAEHRQPAKSNRKNEHAEQSKKEGWYRKSKKRGYRQDVIQTRIL